MSDKTSRNIALGFLLSLVLFLFPFSPVIGGGVTAYLENAMPRRGAKVGLLAALPFALVPVFAYIALISQSFNLWVVAGLIFFSIIYGSMGAVGGYATGYLLHRNAG